MHCRRDWNYTITRLWINLKRNGWCDGQNPLTACSLFPHLNNHLTHWYSFLWVIRVKVSELWGFCTLVSPSDRWTTMETGTVDVTSPSAGPCPLKGISVSWPRWSWTSYLEHNGEGDVCHDNRTWAVSQEHTTYQVYSVCTVYWLSYRPTVSAVTWNPCSLLFCTTNIGFLPSIFIITEPIAGGLTM